MCMPLMWSQDILHSLSFFLSQNCLWPIWRTAQWWPSSSSWESHTQRAWRLCFVCCFCPSMPAPWWEMCLSLWLLFPPPAFTHPCIFSWGTCPCLTWVSLLWPVQKCYSILWALADSSPTKTVSPSSFSFISLGASSAFSTLWWPMTALLPSVTLFATQSSWILGSAWL